MDLPDYAAKIQKESSEMFLCIISLLQTKLPCSANYARYRENYKAQVTGQEETKEEHESPAKKKPSLQIATSPTSSPKVTKIASPKFAQKLSPINQLVKTKGMAVNPLSKYMLNSASAQREGEADSASDDELDCSKFGSIKNNKAEKQKRMAQLEELKNSGKDTVENKNVVRLENRVKNTFIDPVTGSLTQGKS